MNAKFLGECKSCVCKRKENAKVLRVNASFLGEWRSFMIEKSIKIKCKASWGNAKVLCENGEVLRVNAKFLGNKHFAREC